MWGWNYFLEVSTLFLETFNFGSPSHSGIFDGSPQIPFQIDTTAPLLRTSGTCQDPKFRKQLPYSGQVCRYDRTGAPNTPTTRNGWCDDMTICTDYEEIGQYPTGGSAGKVREVSFFESYLNTQEDSLFYSTLGFVSVIGLARGADKPGVSLFAFSTGSR